MASGHSGTTGGNVTQPFHGLLEIARGNIPGVSCVRKFGRNGAVGATTEDIWASGGPYTGFLQTALAVRVKAGGNAADTAAGAGAQEITISGLDENFEPASETVATLGALVSLPTTTTFIRVNRAFVSEAGTYGVNNTGIVTLETTGAAIVALISAGVGQTQMAIYTIPSGQTGYLARFDVINEATSTKSVNVQLWRRERADDVTTPFGPKRLVQAHDTLVGEKMPDLYQCMPSFPEKTDVWVSAIRTGGGADPSVSAQFDIILVDN